VTVPFLAVDSDASREAGRAIWALPKTSASFTRQPGEDAAADARSGGWSVRVASHVVAPPVPAVLLARLEQRLGDETVTAPLTARGWARPARVDVEVTPGGDLPGWFPRGRRWGASVRGVLVLGAPRRAVGAARAD
jgi:hypothetical protein